MFEAEFTALVIIDSLPENREKVLAERFKFGIEVLELAVTAIRRESSSISLSHSSRTFATTLQKRTALRPPRLLLRQPQKCMLSLFLPATKDFRMSS